ncbi:hypothetical protein OAB57_02540 [Bacteriovoracaceae bacterium]|nr:hypothetical protein [Bacteriovoracaceae bacterium]
MKNFKIRSFIVTICIQLLFQCQIQASNTEDNLKSKGASINMLDIKDSDEQFGRIHKGLKNDTKVGNRIALALGLSLLYWLFVGHTMMNPEYEEAFLVQRNVTNTEELKLNPSPPSISDLVTLYGGFVTDLLQYSTLAYESCKGPLISPTGTNRHWRSALIVLPFMANFRAILFALGPRWPVSSMLATGSSLTSSIGAFQLLLREHFLYISKYRKSIGRHVFEIEALEKKSQIKNSTIGLGIMSLTGKLTSILYGIGKDDFRTGSESGIVKSVTMVSGVALTLGLTILANEHYKSFYRDRKYPKFEGLKDYVNPKKLIVVPQKLLFPALKLTDNQAKDHHLLMSRTLPPIAMGFLAMAVTGGGSALELGFSSELTEEELRLLKDVQQKIGIGMIASMGILTKMGYEFIKGPRPTRGKRGDGSTQDSGSRAGSKQRYGSKEDFSVIEDSSKVDSEKMDELVIYKK